MSASTTLIYWSLNARATPSFIVAALGNVALEWDDGTANSWPAAKPSAPFGQLPLLKDGDLTLGQSFALVRYLAKKGGVQGEDLVHFGVSEMITEEASDLFGGLVKAKYDADPLAGFNKLFNETLTTQAGFLENLLKGDFFGGDKALQGDAALFAVLYLYKRANAELLSTVLAAHPKLNAWFARFAALPNIAKAVGILDAKGAYFTWPQ